MTHSFDEMIMSGKKSSFSRMFDIGRLERIEQPNNSKVAEENHTPKRLTVHFTLTYSTTSFTLFAMIKELTSLKSQNASLVSPHH